MALSTTCMAAIASPRKSSKPGVSTRLNLVFSCSQEPTAEKMLVLWSISLWW